MTPQNMHQCHIQILLFAIEMWSTELECWINGLRINGWERGIIRNFSSFYGCVMVTHFLSKDYFASRVTKWHFWMFLLGSGVHHLFIGVVGVNKGIWMDKFMYLLSSTPSFFINIPVQLKRQLVLFGHMYKESFQTH